MTYTRSHTRPSQKDLGCMVAPSYSMVPATWRMRSYTRAPATWHSWRMRIYFCYVALLANAHLFLPRGISGTCTFIVCAAIQELLPRGTIGAGAFIKPPLPRDTRGACAFIKQLLSLKRGNSGAWEAIK